MSAKRRKGATKSEQLIAEILEAARQTPTPRLLAIDSTPAGLVGDRSLRRAFKSEWARIRDRHFRESAIQCTLCRAERAERRLIHGHEVYSFPNPEIVRLERILFVCWLCHDAIHLERTRRKCGPNYIADVETHYCKVNGGISLEAMESDFVQTMHHGFAIREFYGGGNATPKLDFGEYQEGVDNTLKRRRERRNEIDNDDSDFEMFPDHECPWDIKMMSF